MKQPAEIITEPQKKKKLLEKNLGCGGQGLGAGYRLMICTARKSPRNGGGRACGQGLCPAQPRGDPRVPAATKYGRSGQGPQQAPRGRESGGKW